MSMCQRRRPPTSRRRRWNISKFWHGSGGNGGDDITGGPGNDLLNGQGGSDNYYFSGAYGVHKITDSQFGDRLIYGGSSLTGVATRGEGETWYTLGNASIYNHSGALQVVNGGGKVYIYGWTQGDFGITLEDEPEEPDEEPAPPAPDDGSDSSRDEPSLDNDDYLLPPGSGSDWGFPFHPDISGSGFGNLLDWLLELFENLLTSPLVLDQDGDGVELVSLKDSTSLFDLDANGFAQLTGWVAADDALLAIDTNSNGRIDDIGELFGNSSTDGFVELAALDSNSDGVIDSNDAQFGDLLVWQDLDQNQNECPPGWMINTLPRPARIAYA